jgi:hypothetical protein
MKILIKYQLYNQDGDPVIEPFHCHESAKYMVENYFKNCTIVEIEEEYEPRKSTNFN